MTTEANIDPVASLRRGFRIEDKRPERDYHVITCKSCGARWSMLVKAGGINGAGILTLLNHEAGCRTPTP